MKMPFSLFGKEAERFLKRQGKEERTSFATLMSLHSIHGTHIPRHRQQFVQKSFHSPPTSYYGHKSLHSISDGAGFKTKHTMPANVGKNWRLERSVPQNSYMYKSWNIGCWMSPKMHNASAHNSCRWGIKVDYARQQSTWSTLVSLSCCSCTFGELTKFIRAEVSHENKKLRDKDRAQHIWTSPILVPKPSLWQVVPCCNRIY